MLKRLSLLLIFLAVGQSVFAQQKKNNILFIAVDDLKPLLSNYGHPEMKTPNFDRLAAMGVTFTNAHVQQAVCGPSRASIMTGTTPDMTKVWDLQTDFRTSNPALVSMPEYLAQNGYETTAIGKIYHKGSSAPGHDGKSWTIPHMQPEGKDPVYGSAAYEYYQDPEVKEQIAEIESKLKAAGTKGGLREKVFKEIKPSVEGFDVSDEAYQDGMYALEAIKMMKQLSKGAKPFFLGVGFQRPHLPFVAPKKYWDLYDRNKIQINPLQSTGTDIPKIAFHNSGELRAYTDIQKDFDLDQPIDEAKQRELIHGYMACISYIDAQLGKLLDTYLALGLDKNTNIVLWGDHGWHLGDHTLWCKHSNFEQATRAPLMFAGPGVAKGVKLDNPVEMLDIFPTLFDLAGVPQHTQTEGKSLAPLMDKDKKTTVATPFAISQYSRGKDTKGYSLRNERYRYTEWHKNNYNSHKKYDDANIMATELYDYEKDPLESKNLINDPAYAQVLKDLKMQLKAHLENKAVAVSAAKKANKNAEKATGDSGVKNPDAKSNKKKEAASMSESTASVNTGQVKSEEQGSKEPNTAQQNKKAKASGTASSNKTAAENTRTAEGSKPNIVIILADDLGYHDLSFTGSEIYNTPNIDELAKKAKSFQVAYSSYPRCVPSRYAMMTSTYPTNEDHGNLSAIPAENSFIQQFKTSGYQTSYVGKWHLGEDQNSPKGLGFDHSFAAGTAGGTGSHFYPFNNERSKTDPDLHIEDVSETGKKGDYLADLLTDQTVDFIKKADKSKPFMAILAHYAVHTPIEAKKEDIERNKPQIAANSFGGRPEYILEGEGRNKMRQDDAVYAGMVENLDMNVGKILQALKDLGIDKNTIVVFTSDHGGLSNDGNRNQRHLATTNFPLRAGKGHLYEGGVRVPLFIKWDQKIKAGIENESIVLGMDLMPTLLDLALDKKLTKVDGKSYEKVIEGKEKWNDRTVFWHEDKARPYSTGDSKCSSVRSGNYKLMHFYEKDIYEMYDLSKDGSEKDNLYAAQPEKAKELTQLLTDWKKAYHVKHGKGGNEKPVKKDKTPANGKDKPKNKKAGQNDE